MTLVWIIGVLLLGGIVAWLAEGWNGRWPRMVSLATLLGAAALLAVVWIDPAAHLDPALSLPGDRIWYASLYHEWIPRFGVTVLFAMDGLGLLMVALTVFLGIVAVVSSWTEIQRWTGFFQFNLLWTLAGVVGVFTALDLILFFVFWEVMLVPMYFLIAVWGHENRGYAALKFFIFTQVSGLLMLFAIVVLGLAQRDAGGTPTFDYFRLLGADLPAGLSFWLMLGFFAAFMTKLPSVPVHTWLPDAHTQAPTAGSVILAGILLKTGAYGLIRFVVPLFPASAAAFAPVAMGLGALSVIYGGAMAYSQTDFKRLVAYSSVAHMGFVTLGVFAWNDLGLQGAIMTMVTHGFSSAALFMMAGAIQERLHTREMGKMGGLWMHAPRMGSVTMFFVIASVGVPGLGNFIGEFLALLGAFAVDALITIFAAIGLVVSAVYALYMMQHSFQGAPNPDIAGMRDFGAREMSVMVLMMVGLVILGFHPQSLFDVSGPVVTSLRAAADSAFALR